MKSKFFLIFGIAFLLVLTFNFISASPSQVAGSYLPSIIQNYYQMNETSGTAIIDYMHNLNGTANVTNLYPKQGVYFAGSNFIGYDYILGTQSYFTNMPLPSAGSIAFWVQFNQTNINQQIIYQLGGLNIQLFRVGGSTPQIYSSINGGSTFAADGTILTTNVPYLVVFTWDGTGNVHLYVNSTSVTNQASSGSGTTGTVYIASSNGANYMNGYIGPIVIFNQTVNSTVVQDLLNIGATGWGSSSAPAVGNIILNSPQNSTQQVLPVNFNASINAPAGLNITNATLTIWNSTSGTFYGNTTISLSGNNATAIFTNSTLAFSNWTWNVRGCWGNGASGNCSYAPNNYTVQISPYIIFNEVYYSPIIGGSYSTFQINVSTSTGYSVKNNSFYYNGTMYSGITLTLSSSLYQTTVNVPTPIVAANINLSFSWNLTMSDSNMLSIQHNQSLIPLPILSAGSNSCGAGLSNPYIFNLLDEVNLTLINGSMSYNFQYGAATNNTALTINGTLSNTNILYLCFNSTLTNLTLGYGQIQYNSPGDANRVYYLFSGTSLTPITNNINIYDISTTLESPFTVLVEDNSLNLFTGKYVTLVRWYPGLNQYNVVDMGQTDSSGNAILHPVPTDVDYRMGIYGQDGTLIYLSPAQRLVCTSNPCTFTLKVPSSATRYTYFNQIQGYLSYQNSTGIWTFVWSDPSQITQDMNLTVYKMAGDNVFPVCSNQVTGFAGAVSCNTSGYTGTLEGVVYQNVNPLMPFTSLLITVGNSVFTSGFGLWLSFLIGIPIALIFILVSPIMAIVGGILALVPAVYLQSVPFSIIGAFAVLGGIAVHFIRRTGG